MNPPPTRAESSLKISGVGHINRRLGKCSPRISSLIGRRNSMLLSPHSESERELRSSLLVTQFSAELFQNTSWRYERRVQTLKNNLEPQRILPTLRRRSSQRCLTRTLLETERKELGSLRRKESFTTRFSFNLAANLTSRKHDWAASGYNPQIGYLSYSSSFRTGRGSPQLQWWCGCLVDGTYELFRHFSPNPL